jgi:Ni/Co efflux regulator RcnB
MMMKSHWAMTCTTLVMAVAVAAAIPTLALAQRADEGQKPVAEHTKFNDNDRQVTRTWYDGHQSNLPSGLKDTDRMAPATESQFKEGYVLDKATRKDVHTVPSTLLKLLAPAPRNYRYVAVDGYVVMIDGSYKVADVMSVRHDK